MTEQRVVSDSSQTYDFVVAGGGIGGLSCALALARKGFRVAVLERAREFAGSAIRVARRGGIEVLAVEFRVMLSTIPVVRR